MAIKPQKSMILPGCSALQEQPTTLSVNPDGGKPGLVFSEMAHLGKLNLRADNSASKSVTSVTGCTFPPAANKLSTAGDRHVVWLGPDEFLVLCEAGKDEELASTLDSTLNDQHCAVTNITDALAAFNLKGTAVRQVLAKGCAIDLHPNSFKVGDAAQTLLSHAAVTLLAVSNNELIIICRTSYASFLHDWLCDAALEYGVQYRK